MSRDKARERRHNPVLSIRECFPRNHHFTPEITMPIIEIGRLLDAWDELAKDIKSFDSHDDYITLLSMAEIDGLFDQKFLEALNALSDRLMSFFQKGITESTSNLDHDRLMAAFRTSGLTVIDSGRDHPEIIDANGRSTVFVAKHDYPEQRARAFNRVVRLFFNGDKRKVLRFY